jgi:multidrug efflux pump subunit AcrB
MTRRTLMVTAGATLVVGVAVAWLVTRYLGSARARQELQVLVQVVAAGLSPQEADALVARPLEAGLADVTGLTAMETACVPGAVTIATRFEPGTEPLQASLALRKALEGVSAALPAGVEPPQVHLPVSREALWSYTLRCDRCARGDLLTLQEQTLRPALLAVPGVTGVSASGGGRREVQIRTDPARLHRLGLGLRALTSAIGSGVASGLLPRSSPHLIRTRERDAGDPARLSRLVVSRRPTGVVRLSDVATIRLAVRPPRCPTLHNGRPALHVIVYGRQPSGDGAGATERAAAQVRARLQEHAREHARRGLVLRQLDPHRAVALRLVGKHRPARPIPGVDDLVVRTCERRDAGESMLWAWPRGDALVARIRAVVPGAVPPGSTLVMEVLEHDPKVLVRRGEAVVRWLKARDEVLAVESRGLERAPELQLRPRRERMAALGLTVPDLAASLRAAQHGIAVTDGVRLVLPAPEDLGQLQIRTSSGTLVQVRQVADLWAAEAPAVILRCDRRRCAVVKAWVRPGASERLRAALWARFPGYRLR